MHELILSPLSALTLALNAEGLFREEIFRYHSSLEEGLYHIFFCTDWLHYEFYISAATGELLGLNTEPIGEAEVLDSRSTSVFWKLKYNIIAAEN